MAILNPEHVKIRPLFCVLTLLTGLSYFALQHNGRAASRVLPFQGLLRDARGNPVPDGAKVVQFKIYDASVGGQAVWNGELQKLTVNSGLVSTLLGTKANLSGVDFNRDLYLELTMDANNDGQITDADPVLSENSNAAEFLGNKWPMEEEFSTRNRRRIAILRSIG